MITSSNETASIDLCPNKAIIVGLPDKPLIVGLDMPEEPLIKFLAAHGRRFQPAPRPKGVRYRKAKCCFINASELVSVGKHRDRNWTYCEGLASLSGLLWFHHAWAVDSEGNVIDPTLRIAPEALSSVHYFGVPFERRFAFIQTDKTTVLRSILVHGVEPEFAT